MTHWRHRVVALCLLTGSGTAGAQPVASIGGGVDLVSDHVVRGLSWSDGKPALTGWVQVPLTSATLIALDVAMTREAERAAGADLMLSPALRQRLSDGPVRIDAGGRCHVFVGGSGAAYCEITGGMTYDIAFATVDAGLAYAPGQDAIGSDNLHLRAGASVALPGTPLSISGAVGHSSAVLSGDGSPRLRPGGAYWDHVVGLGYTRGTIVARLEHVSASLVDAVRGRSKVVARIGIAL